MVLLPFLISTTHSLHAPDRDTASWEQSEGIAMPAARAASSSMVSFSAVIFLPSIIKFTIVYPTFTQRLLHQICNSRYTRRNEYIYHYQSCGASSFLRWLPAWGTP